MQSGERFGDARVLRCLVVASFLAVVLFAGPERALGLGQAGDADPTFHGGTPVLADLAETVPRVTYFSNLVIDGAGRIVIAGSSTDANGRTAIALARYTADGAVDASFGAGGSRVVQMGSGTFAYSVARSLFSVPGRYVGLAVSRMIDGRSDQTAYVLGANGFGDPGFGNDGAGIASVDYPPDPQSGSTSGAAAAPDGTIYVSGSSSQGSGEYAVQVSKFTPQGQLGTNFPGLLGVYEKKFGQQPGSLDSRGGPVAAMPDGSIVIAGQATLADGGYGLLLAHLSSGGTLDGSFGNLGGYSVVDVSDPSAESAWTIPNEVVIGPDREIYVVGLSNDAAGEQAAMIARFTPNGQPDFTFGSGGVVRIQFSPAGKSSSFSHMLLQPDGKIIAFADVFKGSRIVRLLEDGSLDPSFGAGGIVTPNLGGPDSGLSGGQIVGGRLLVSGYVEQAGRVYGALSAYLLAPLPDAGTPGPPQRGTLKLRKKRLKVDGKGRVGIPLACSAAGPCKGRLALIATTGKATVSKAKKAKVYAKRAYSLAAGAKKTIRLKVSKPARARAAAKAGFRVRLALAPEASKMQLVPVTLHR